MLIIIKDSKPKGRTRTGTDKELKDAGWGSSFKNESDADKCEFIERKLKTHLGMDNSRVNAHYINDLLTEEKGT